MARVDVTSWFPCDHSEKCDCWDNGSYNRGEYRAIGYYQEDPHSEGWYSAHRIDGTLLPRKNKNPGSDRRTSLYLTPLSAEQRIRDGRTEQEIHMDRIMKSLVPFTEETLQAALDQIQRS